MPNDDTSSEESNQIQVKATVHNPAKQSNQGTVPGNQQSQMTTGPPTQGTASVQQRNYAKDVSLGVSNSGGLSESQAYKVILLEII